MQLIQKSTKKKKNHNNDATAYLSQKTNKRKKEHSPWLPNRVMHYVLISMKALVQDFSLPFKIWNVSPSSRIPSDLRGWEHKLHLTVVGLGDFCCASVLYCSPPRVVSSFNFSNMMNSGSYHFAINERQLYVI